mmetsp:Transcript_40279/g.89457  ORF Transcript_40279/g.89457 Transcript_40279/m.89457 type:complete len:310 (+) Transcript_40279:148-1077(+)
MPKQRSSDRRHLDFQVSPWLDKQAVSRKHANPGDCDVQFTSLISEKRPQPDAAETAGAGHSNELLSSLDASSWYTKRAPTHDGNLDNVHGSEASPACNQDLHESEVVDPTCRTQCSLHGTDSEEDEASRQYEGSAAADTAASADLKQNHPPDCCRGISQLAMLESGHMSGHLVDFHTQQCYGIMGKCLTTTAQSLPACEEDADTDVLKLTIYNFKGQGSVDAVVEKTGGDLAKFTPASSWYISRYLDPADPGELERMQEVQVSFNGSQLLEGQLAEEHVRKFFPRLSGRNALVNIGIMEIRGLPPGFVS